MGNKTGLKKREWLHIVFFYYNNVDEWGDSFSMQAKETERMMGCWKLIGRMLCTPTCNASFNSIPLFCLVSFSSLPPSSYSTPCLMRCFLTLPLAASSSSHLQNTHTHTQQYMLINTLKCSLTTHTKTNIPTLSTKNFFLLQHGSILHICEYV